MTEGSPTNAASPPQPLSTGRVGAILGLLFIVNVFNFLDRQLPFILAESIKKDLNLSDTQIGLLGGVAFAVVYSTLALPLAKLADRWSAKWVIIGSLSVWSALTAAGGAAQNFAQLVATRMGVAAGEAGSTPAAHAIISTTVPEERRGLAIGLFSMGVSVGGMLGLALGGVLHDAFGWRATMIMVGLPGLAFALLLVLVLPNSRPAVASTGPAPSFVDSARALFAKKSYRHLCFGVTAFGVGTYAAYTFTAPFMIRTYDMTATEVGLWLGISNGIAGVAGALGGGWLSDRVAKNHPSRVLWLPAAAFALSVPLIILGYTAPTAALSIALLLPVKTAGVFYLAPSFRVGQALAGTQSRAISSAILLFGLSLVGASLGPVLTGVISDALAPRFGERALGYALCVAAVFMAWAVVHLVIASRALPQDLARMQAAEGA
jgi:predicted MFS family arabinose efflux permease